MQFRLKYVKIQRDKVYERKTQIKVVLAYDHTIKHFIDYIFFFLYLIKTVQ
jgi:hypothetical protein